MGLTVKTVRNLNCFVYDFKGSRFYLLGSGMLCAVRVLRLLCAVIQLFYKPLHHLPLHSGCNLMFWLLILWTVVSFSNIWNDVHLRILFARFGYVFYEKCFQKLH